MTAKQIKDAAIKHAKIQLSDEQYESNKNAARAVMDDFKAGVKWAKENSKPAVERTDDSSHHYLIPAEKVAEFDRLMDLYDVTDYRSERSYEICDEINNKFGQYRK